MVELSKFCGTKDRLLKIMKSKTIVHLLLFNLKTVNKKLEKNIGSNESFATVILHINLS